MHEILSWCKTEVLSLLRGCNSNLHQLRIWSKELSSYKNIFRHLSLDTKCTRLKLAWSLVFQNSFLPLLFIFYPISSFLVSKSRRCKHWQNHRIIQSFGLENPNCLGFAFCYSCWFFSTFQPHSETLMCTLWKYRMVYSTLTWNCFKSLGDIYPSSLWSRCA